MYLLYYNVFNYFYYIYTKKYKNMIFIKKKLKIVNGKL